MSFYGLIQVRLIAVCLFVVLPQQQKEGRLMDNYRDKTVYNNRQGMNSDAQEAKRLRNQLVEYDGYLQEMRKSTLKNVETLDVIQRYTDKSAEGIQSLTEESAAGVQKLVDESLQGIQKLTAEGASGLKSSAAAGENGVNQLVEESLRRIADLAEISIRQMETVSEESMARLQNLAEESLEKIEEVNQRNVETAKRVEEIREMMAGQTMSLQEMHKASDELSHKENVKVYRNVQAVVVEEVKKQTDDLKKAWKGVKPLLAVTLLAALANVTLFVLQIMGILK